MFHACCYDSLLIHATVRSNRAPGPFDKSGNNWSLEETASPGKRTFGGEQLDFYREKLQRNKWRSGEMKEISFPQCRKLLCESAAEGVPLTAPSAQRVNLPLLNY